MTSQTQRRLRAALLAGLLAAPISAAATPLVRDMPLMRRALTDCGGDIAAFCSGVAPGGGRIAQCLLDHQTRLSAACAETVDRGAALRTAYFACYADAQTHCPDTPLGAGRVAACLKDSAVTPICRDAIAAAEAAWAQ